VVVPDQHTVQISSHVISSYSFLKDTVYRSNPHTVPGLKQETSADVVTIN